MASERRTLSVEDAQWLEYWMRRLRLWPGPDQPRWRLVQALLGCSDIVERAQLDPDVATTGSIVQLFDTERNAYEVCWLVPPGKESLLLDKVSVLSDTGLELLGRRVGTPLLLQAPQGRRAMRITKLIHQAGAQHGWGA